ncbi:hypothetical protein [Roseobacter sp.]|uniref:hypothetical protein n=1 Tax=Roseobacter sp. TaxID=1907202 RepID=UPI0025EFF2DE|nr:hypothetical protein [Roseobacter sp.]
MPISLAEKKCLQRGLDFGWQFRNQYVLSCDSDRNYPGWFKQHLGRWTLHHGDALRVTHMTDQDGAHVGWILGHAIAPGRGIAEDSFQIAAHHSQHDFADVAEGVISDLAGKYLVILLTGDTERVYCDPVSDLPLLYDAQTGRLASSLGLVLDRPVVANPLFPARDVLSGKRTLSFGHTIDRTVKRGLSSHYLDLSDFGQHRHWPPMDMAFSKNADDTKDIVDQIIERLSSHITVLTERFDCILPVSGGRDSRILLACASDRLDKLSEISGHRFHNPSRRDTALGKEIVQSLGKEYKTYFRKYPEMGQMRNMRLRMGWSGARPEMEAVPMIEDLPRDHIVLRGNILELLRASQWRRDKIDRPVHLTHGVRRLGVCIDHGGEERKKWFGAYTDWLESLPPSAQKKPYDFAWVELLLPNWQGAYFNGHNSTYFLNPFNDRKLIELAISLPASLRINGEVVPLILERACPELLNFRFQ